MEKKQFNHFSHSKSMGILAAQHYFSHFEIPLLKQLFYQIRPKSFSGFTEVVFMKCKQKHKRTDNGQKAVTTALLEHSKGEVIQEGHDHP